MQTRGEQTRPLSALGVVLQVPKNFHIYAPSHGRIPVSPDSYGCIDEKATCYSD